MIWRFVSTGLILVFLTCFCASGCSSLGSGQNKNGKSSIFSLPASLTKSKKNKPKKIKKTNQPQSLDALLALPRY
ncbi:MAG: hypothetical protein LBP59_01350 [Planctomycetaceae bacterium]|nr:hypothetical protein [Planctomycetaceae bacterium]